MKILVFICVLSSIYIAQSCDEDESGKEIGAPMVEPPVVRNTPAGLQSDTASLRLTELPTTIQTIKERLFTDGPTELKRRLAYIDERMGSLNARAKDSPRKCLDNASSEWMESPTMPNGEAFPMYFQCQEELNEENQLAFGFEGDYFYLLERTKNTEEGGEGIFVMAKAKRDGTSVEFWQITSVPEEEGVPGQNITAYTFTHAKADDATGLLEFVHAGNSSGSGVACGIHVQTSADNLWGAGIFAAPSNPPDEDCSGNETTSTEICVNAVSLEETDAADCSSVSTFSLTDMTYQSLEEEGGYATARAITDLKVSGYQSFND